MATIDLCMLDDVKRHRALDSVRGRATVDVDVDERLQVLISAVSNEVERFCGRWFRKASRTQVLDPVDNQRVMQVRAYPLASISSLKYELGGDFASATAIDTDDFTILDGGRAGQFALRWANFTGGIGSVQVIYIGGLAERTEGLPGADAGDLMNACVEQVAFQWAREPNIDLRAQTQSQGGATYFGAMDFLPGVKRVLRRYKRIGHF